MDKKADTSGDKLTPIIEAADDLAWLIAGSMRRLRTSPDGEEKNISKADAAVYKEFTSTLKNLTAIIRDVNELPSAVKEDEADSSITFILSDDAEELSK